MKTRNNCRKSAKWLLATILVAGAALCAVGEAGNCPVSANVRGHENIEWSISYAFGLTDATRDLPLLTIYLYEAEYDVIHFNNGLHSLETPTDAWAKGLKAALELVRKNQNPRPFVWNLDYADLKPGSYKFSARLLYVTQKNGRVMAERDFWI